MPAKLRVAKERRPQFGAEVLALFAELEATPMRDRNTAEFRARDRALARHLNLAAYACGAS